VIKCPLKLAYFKFRKMSDLTGCLANPLLVKSKTQTPCLINCITCLAENCLLLQVYRIIIIHNMSINWSHCFHWLFILNISLFIWYLLITPKLWFHDAKYPYFCTHSHTPEKHLLGFSRLPAYPSISVHESARLPLEGF